MDNLPLSDIFGIASGAFIVAGQWLQSRHPDAQSMRIIRIAVTAFSALSFWAQGKPIGMWGGIAGCFRSAARATKLGTLYRKHVSFAAPIAMAIATGKYAENWTDFLPLGGIAVGSWGDYSNEGRYTRARSLLTAACMWLPYSIGVQNWPIAFNSAAVSLIYMKSIYEHDIKDAAGQNRSLIQNFRAYRYGRKKDVPTGADPKGFISQDNGYEVTDSDINQVMKDIKKNPHFLDLGLNHYVLKAQLGLTKIRAGYMLDLCPT